MQYLPIHTRTLVPPQDDLSLVIRESLKELHEGDIVLITSKVVSIHEGNVVPIESISKRDLVIREAEQYIEADSAYAHSPLAIKHHALFFAAGVDESNGNGYYICLPKDPFRSAQILRDFLRETYKVSNLGVIITDSHSMPMRRGCVSISIGYAGFHPVSDHKGRKDLFGREIRISATNVVDSLAGGASAVSGEVDEATPIVIARDVPSIRFTDEETKDEHLIAPEDDIYAPLLRQFYT